MNEDDDIYAVAGTVSLVMMMIILLLLGFGLVRF